MRSLFGHSGGQEDTIERLCRESGGWLLVGREGDRHRVRATHYPGPSRYVDVLCGDQWDSLVFQAWFPVRFPLDSPPSGLFGRLLMRNFDLRYAGWTVQIAGSCEASPCVAGRLPRRGIDATLFDLVGREVLQEIDAFDRELRDKFRYGVGGVVPMQPPAGNPRLPEPAVPEIQFIEPVQQHAIQHARYRMLPGS